MEIQAVYPKNSRCSAVLLDVEISIRENQAASRIPCRLCPSAEPGGTLAVSLPVPCWVRWPYSSVAVEALRSRMSAPPPSNSPGHAAPQTTIASPEGTIGHHKI